MLNMFSNVRSDRRTINIVEFGGRGGVYQHALAMGKSLRNEGYTVVLHTATDFEITDDSIDYCCCYKWFRGQSFRSVRILLRFLLVTLPHIVKLNTGPIWIQGTFKASLTLLLIFLLRSSRQKVLMSPHNLFSRTGSSAEKNLILKCAQLSTLTVVYNSVDAMALRNLKIPCLSIPLEMYAPTIEDSVITKWCGYFGEDEIIIGAIGQIRSDKNLDLLVNVCQRAGVRLVIMGSNIDHLPLDDIGIDYDLNLVTLLDGYHSMQDLAAVAALCDGVALMYSQASQSGVAALAQSYGTPVIAYDTGALGERADILLDSLDPDSWVQALAEFAHDQISPRRNKIIGPLAGLQKKLPEELRIVIESII
jgi:glycosyltransferase involved in cell wall biosynthesis